MTRGLSSRCSKADPSHPATPGNISPARPEPAKTGSVAAGRASSPSHDVGNSLGGWIAWLIAQEFEQVERLILIAPAFNMMGVRAKQISDERRHDWHRAGWMPWEDDPLHKDWPLSWKWVEESEAYWKTSSDRLRHVRTTILHGLQDTVILPEGSRRFVEQLLARDLSFPVELNLIPGDHRLSIPEHVERFHRLVLETP